jgi:hypothetical protein
VVKSEVATVFKQRCRKEYERMDILLQSFLTSLCLEVSGGPYISATLFPREKTHYPFYRSVGGQESRSDVVAKRKLLASICSRLAGKNVTLRVELSWLRAL